MGGPAYNDAKAAEDMLQKIRPYVTRFSSSGYIDEMAQGSLCAVMGYSGDINIARARAIDAKNGVKLEALIPEKGRWRSVDPVAAGRRVGPRAATVYRRALWTDGVELAAPKGLIPVFLPVGSGLVELPGDSMSVFLMVLPLVC